MESFSKIDALKVGWRAFLQKPFFLVSIVLGVTLVSVIADTVIQSIVAPDVVTFTLAAFSFVLNTIISMGLLLIALRVYDGTHTSYAAIIEPVHLFWKYLFTTLITGIAFLVGVALFIIPGIIIELVFSMALFVVIDKEYSSFDALYESYRITHGHRLNILLFIAVLAVFNMLGALALGVGLLVTVPVSLLAFVAVYRWLLGERSALKTISIGWKSWVLAVALVAGGVGVLAAAVVAPLAYAPPATVEGRDAIRQAYLIDTQIGLEGYFATQAVYPATLSALVPAYLTAVPADPVTGEAPLYTVFDGGSDYELCVVFEDPTIGIACEYGVPFNDESTFDFDAVQ